MTSPRPLPPVESKVKWAGTATYLGTVLLLALLDTVSADPTLLSPLPDWLEVPLVALVPTFVVLLAGIRAPHTPRPDLPMDKR